MARSAKSTRRWRGRSIGRASVSEPSARATKKGDVMPLVNVMVNNRAYTIACDDGEEPHLKELAAHVDEKAREVLASVGQVGDARMLLMAALLIADEHHDLAGKVTA